MKVNRNIVEIIVLLAVYLLGLYMWTLPLHNNPYPFGDVDASSHFAIGDLMAGQDKSVLYVPFYLQSRYGGQNDFKEGALWYAPQYWTNTGIVQLLGGDRTLPVFLLVAIFSSAILLTSYFLARQLFGFLPAILSTFLLIFSARDFMIYLWGQWPQSLSFAYTPLVLYAFYQYTAHYLDKKEKPIYLYLMALFLAAQLFFHPQGLIASAAALIVYTIVLAVRHKRLPFSLKQASLAGLLFLGVCILLAPFNFGEFVVELFFSDKGGGAPSEGSKFMRLFWWYQGIKNDPGIPSFYFTYNLTHGSLNGGLLSWWTLPLLLIGLFVLFSRRNEKDWVYLSWLAAFYFLTRLVVFGIGNRDIRMFAFEAHVFYPIIAIGLLAIPSFFPVGEKHKAYLKYGLVVLFLLLAVFVNGKSAWNTLESQQQSVGRVNPSQYEAAVWIKDNIPMESTIYDFGTLGFQNYAAKVKWLNVLSQHNFVLEDRYLNQTEYVLVDYTDALNLGDTSYRDAIQQWESQRFDPSQAIYNKNNIRVYRVVST
ncbi:hypothetical protein J4453_03140 [Candidatus Woesearchaeota archaeon]|nr:hypothetical protein [Candidatus Woesearchaeota archaeon]